MQNIAPGSKIVVKITKRPTNAAAAKTLVRLLSKDPAVKVQDARLRKRRQEGLRQKQRGGRLWNTRVVKQAVVQLTPGAPGSSGTITATLDVLTDLKSVSRFVEVTAA